MVLDTDRLVSQSTYAKSIGKTRQWVSQMVKSGKIEFVVIDGTPYIILDKPPEST